jgi:hypothetical protein
MSWWETGIEGKKFTITIYSFSWKVFVALLLAGILLIAIALLKSLLR